jgi:hypothetical protein
MNRRAFIAGLGGAAAWPVVARGQQPGRIAKIGYIESGSPSTSPNLLAAFRRGLRELGYVEGQTCSSSSVTPKERRSVSLNSPLNLSSLVWT